MNKYKKSSIAMIIMMVVLMFIPTFNYSAEHFDYDYNYFNGLSFNSLGITDYNESVITLGINGYKNEKYGLFIILAGIVLMLTAIFLKFNLSRWMLLIGSCLPVVGSIIQIIRFYNQPYMGTRIINQPPYIAFVLIIIELLLIIVSIKNLSANSKSDLKKSIETV